MDGPYKGKITKSTKWTDSIRVENFDSPQSGRIKQVLITWRVQEVDGPNKSQEI